MSSAFGPPFSFELDTEPSVAELLALAEARPECAWTAEHDIADARNAHFTNTPAQMAHALQGDFNCLEGDVRLVDGRAMMAHDVLQPGVLPYADWARIAHSSGRMLRIDIKESDALPQVLQVLDELGVPDWQLAINVSVLDGFSAANQPLETVRQLRASRPLAWICLNIATYEDDDWLRALADVAPQIAGERSAVAIEAQHATAARLKILQPALRVGVWNCTSRYVPDDLVDEAARVRALGVDGMVDLRA